jgi:hypothetical protein
VKWYDKDQKDRPSSLLEDVIVIESEAYAYDDDMDGSSVASSSGSASSGGGSSNKSDGSGGSKSPTKAKRREKSSRRRSRDEGDLSKKDPLLDPLDDKARLDGDKDSANVNDRSCRECENCVIM